MDHAHKTRLKVYGRNRAVEAAEDVEKTVQELRERIAALEPELATHRAAGPDSS